MAVYDPNTKYGWEKDTKFDLTGNEFGLILNTFRTILQSPEAQKILIMSEANKAIESVLKRNVESGAVVPSKTEDKSPDKPIPNAVPMEVVQKEDIK